MITLVKVSGLVIKIWFVVLTSVLINLGNASTYILLKKLIDALVIGTIVVHPFLFYLSLILLFFNVFKKFNFLKLVSCKVYTNTLLVILTSALCLGGFWGLQSNAWGYLWANDAIEWLLIFIILAVLFNLHILTSFQMSVITFTLISLIFNFTLFIRLNLITTRHSFLVNFELILIILLSYYTFFYMIYNILLIKKSNSNMDFMTVLIFVIFIQLFNLNWLSYLLKLFFFICLCFFYKKLSSLFWKFMCMFTHLFIFIFIFVWIIFFKFFFIQFSILSSYSFSEVRLFPKIFNSISIYNLKSRLSTLLESISFKLSSNGLRLTQLLNNLYIKLTLNNTYLMFSIIVLLLFLVKMFESGLLHKKKTYF